jgi:hypothetical protein
VTKEEIFSRFERIGVNLADYFRPGDAEAVMKKVRAGELCSVIIETDPVQEFDFATAEELGPCAIACSEDGKDWGWRPEPEYIPGVRYRLFYEISPELAYAWLERNKERRIICT